MLKSTTANPGLMCQNFKRWFYYLTFAAPLKAARFYLKVTFARQKEGICFADPKSKRICLKRLLGPSFEVKTMAALNDSRLDN